VHGKTLAVPDALVAPDLDLPADVGLHLAAQVALDPVVRLDVLAQRDQLGLRELVHPQVTGDAGGGEGLERTGASDSEDVGQRDLDPLVAGEVDTGDTCHRAVSFPWAEVLPTALPSLPRCGPRPPTGGHSPVSPKGDVANCGVSISCTAEPWKSEPQP
jgi:hypothetical protein